MMQTIEVPGYGEVDFPDDMTDQQIEKAIKDNYFRDGKTQKSLFDEAKQAQQHAQMTHQQLVKPSSNPAIDFPIGALKGASDIGATILGLPYYLGAPIKSPQERRDAVDQFAVMEGADPNSFAYNLGKIGTEIAGTAGVGGLFSKGAQVVGAAPKIVNSLRTGGFNLGSQPSTTFAGKAADMATRIAGGGAVGAGTAGMIDPSQVGEGTTIGALMPPSIKGSMMLGKGVRNLLAEALGATTGVGAESVKTAFKSGLAGDKAFVDNMRGNVSFNDVVDNAKQALARMRDARALQYRNGMVDIANDKTVIDMTPIIQELNQIKQMGNYKGLTYNKAASGTIDDISSIVNEWANQSPTEFHTPEGLDKLKQAIGDIRMEAKPGTSARKAADRVYNAIKSEINAQAPTYSKVMRDYAEASDTLEEISKSLSLGDKASRDTAIRKLQSLMRNNAQTNYGNRLDLANKLEKNGGASLLPSLAGQSMNTWMPRGMTGAAAKVGFPGAAMMNPSSWPALIGAAPFFSPRTMGETLYGLGRSAGASKDAVLPLVANNMQRLGLLNPQAINNEMSMLRTLPLAISAGQ